MVDGCWPGSPEVAAGSTAFHCRWEIDGAWRHFSLSFTDCFSWNLRLLLYPSSFVSDVHA
jgi:hypothetical protein